MTEERKRYLASISKEERIIRKQIEYYKDRIKVAKYDLTLTQENWLKEHIYKFKMMVKLLKKQLPAPIVEVEHEYRYSYHCPICKKVVACSLYYCPDCGQKLR